MSGAAPSLVQAARRLLAALQAETALARAGGVRELAAASETKRLAFANF